MSINKPLTREQVKKLPVRKTHFETDKRGNLIEVVDHDGFTPTSVGITGQQLKRAGREKNFQAPRNNRKTTAGRIVQIVPSTLKRDKDGNVIVGADGKVVYTRERKIIHETPRRRMNV